MGLASSQARMLLLVGRKSDLEYRGQMINQRRMNIAWQTERVAKEYTDKMSNMKLEVKSVNADGITTNQVIKSSFLHASNMAAVYIEKNADGTYKEVLPTAAEGSSFDNSARIKALYDAGLIKFVEYSLSGGTPVYGNEVNVTTSPKFNYTYDTSDDATASAKYEFESARLQTQDKQLEIELKNVDTQHNAVQTEIDAVKKVIEKNIESSFKTFG